MTALILPVILGRSTYNAHTACAKYEIPAAGVVHRAPAACN